jgi:putative ABC transport system permease protein
MPTATHRAGWKISLDTVWQDVRLALRVVRRSPGFAATIVLTLALGIGANAAIFGVVNSLLLRPLPVADPHRLVTISSDAAIARGYPTGFGWSFAMWQALQPHVALFDGAIAWRPVRFDLAQSGERQPVEGVFASGGYFATLGVPAILGRTFTAADDRPGGGPEGPVAVISYGLWQRRFGGAASVIGGPLVVDGVTVTIVGVTPPAFFGVDVGRAFDVALPLETEPLVHANRSTLGTSRLLVMLRLKPDQPAEAGTAILRGLQPAILGVTPETMSTVRPPHNREPFTLASAAAGTSLPVRGPSGLRQSYERPLLTILVVVLLVLVIACVNLANLLLARATARRHELSVRLALGAPRVRLVRQLLIESLVLAASGAIGGLVIAAWGSHALVAQLSTATDRITLDLSFDWRVLAFTAGVAVATAGIFGTVPAFRATRVAPIEVLKMQGRATSQHAAGAGRLATLSSGLVIAQIALSLALVVAAGLFVRSFERLSHVPLGFDPDRVLVINVDTERTRTDPADRVLLYQRIVDAAGRAPGVAHAGGSIWTPVDGGMRMGDPQTRAQFNFVTPGWFAAYGTAVRIGRDFSVRDTAEAPPVAVVNEAFARALMAGRFPLGETIPYFRSRGGGLRTIVGVVDDAVFESQREGIPPIVYLPVAQSAGIGPRGLTEISVGVRPAVGSPMQLARSVGAAITGVDPGLAYTFRVLTDHVDASVRQERLLAMLSGFFGGLALLIAALGLYGVTSYTVNRRFTEIGIRMALGADRTNVLGLVLGQSLALTAVGIGLGLAGASAVTRYLRGMLFGLTPLDPETFIGVAVLFAVVATLAASIPAYRATKVDPLVALRND